MIKMKIENIVGSGGKGGGAHTPTEYENTLISDSIVSLLEIISEGEIKGLVDGNKSIYFDDVPIVADDDTKNFQADIGYRYGLPDQPYLEGWPSAESLHEKNLDIKKDLPAIHQVINQDADAVKIIIGLPSGLSEQKSNGDTVGSEVSLSVLTADSSGVYSFYQTYTINGKTTSAFYRTYRINRPAGSTGAWSAKVVRNTDDATSQSLRNDTRLVNIVEIDDVKLQFNNTAYIGLKVSAKSTSNKVPVRSYLIDGIKVLIPDNYDPINNTYTGQWDGTFKTDWTDNPAWILYDLLTNDRYGCGRWIKPDDIDVYSFYDSAVYNDQLVPDGKGGLERRFTFNGVISNQDDAISVLQQVAGSFNSVILQEGRLYRLQQDRPSTPVAILTNANVVDGQYIYQGSPHQARHTVVNVTYNDKNNKYKEQITTVEASPSELERYNGITAINIKAVGAVTEGQALRAGKWHIETELNQKEIAKWSMSFNGFELRVGDVVTIADRNYTTIDSNGRILDVVGDLVTLDRDVNLVVGDTFNYVDIDNQISSFEITESSSGNKLTLPEGRSIPKIGGVFSAESVVKNRQFRITGYSQSEKHVLDFTAIQHDPNKYARVEQGLSIPSPIYSSSLFNRSVNPPTNISFGVSAFVSDEGVRRDLNVSWHQSINSSISHYNFSHRINNGNWINSRADGASFDIKNIVDGIYDVKVNAVGLDGVQSRTLTGTYTYSLSGGTGSLLNPVTDLAVRTGGFVFNDINLDIKFANPSSNTYNVASLKDFRIDVLYPDDSIAKSYYVDPVPAGETVYWQYSYDRIRFDLGFNRSFKLVVYCRDTDNKLSVGNTKTFANPVPSAPTVTVKPGVKSLMIETGLPTDRDYAGTVIWASQTSGFVPSNANKIYQGPNIFYILENITGTWFVKVAHYDSFDDGNLTGLNISSQYSGTTANVGGIPTGSVLPVSPTNNEYSFYLDVAGASKGLYGWNGSNWIKVSDLTNATGKISTTQINDNAITTPKIATNSITSALIVAGAVTADKLTVNNLSGISANLGSITSGSITLDNAGYIRGGADSFGVGTGIWQGYDSGYYKWRVGTPGSSRAEWNGSSFNIYDASGNLTISSGVVDYTKINNKPTALSAINSTESNKLASIASGATVGASFDVNISGQINSYNIGTYIAGLSISNAYISDAAITNAKIADASITSAKIVDASITSAKIGDASITNAKISGNLQSDNFVAGVSGWQIRKSDGGAEFSGVTVRGDLYDTRQYTAGTNVVISALRPVAPVLPNNTTLVKVKEFRVSRNGTISYYAEAKPNLNWSGTTTHYLRVIKNTNTFVNDNFWSSNGSDTAIKSVSGNVTVNAGDTISVWLQSTAGNNNMVQNFKLLSGSLYYETVTMDG